MHKKIAILPGDGIGSEIMDQALRVINAIAEKYKHTFELTHSLIGGSAWEQHGCHFPEHTQQICKEADAILFGSVGGPVSEQHLEKWHNCEVNSILGLRKAFGFNANLRPSKVYPALIESSPLKRSVLEGGVDVLIVRELLGGLYFGEHRTSGEPGNRVAVDVCEYSETQITSVAHTAFKAAQKRRGKVTLVDKANVLDTSRLWRSVVGDLAKSYPDIEYSQMYVDNCAMQLVQNPGQFDVILAENLFGDILSDIAAVLPGSLGLLCSSSSNDNGFAMYEPPGGSAPDIANKGIANPIGQIRCVAMMFQHSFGLTKEAESIEQAVETVLNKGLHTSDIYREKPGTQLVGTKEITSAITATIT